jgi:hypothetical protein
VCQLKASSSKTTILVPVRLGALPVAQTGYADPPASCYTGFSRGLALRFRGADGQCITLLGLVDV